MSWRTVMLPIFLLVLLASCGTDGSDSGAEVAVESLAERLAVVDAHVEDWRNAGTLAGAKRAAEAAANHVVGPNGPAFGDRDGDGEVRGPM